MVYIPYVKVEISSFHDVVEYMRNPNSKKYIILTIVCIALLLDNMLYMVIVPILPEYLMQLTKSQDIVSASKNISNMSINDSNESEKSVEMEQDFSIGLLFASKAILQLMINPLSGTIIDRIGCEKPLVFGLFIMFFSTVLFAFGQSYGAMFFARLLQGLGSAFADTSGFALIANTFTDEQERTQSLGWAIAFISFGSLAAPPFGGILYQYAGKNVPFLILSMVALVDGAVLLYINRKSIIQFAPKPYENAKPCVDELGVEAKTPTPIYKLLLDPYIAICAGALSMSNVCLAFLEPTIAVWMRNSMQATESQIGLVWLFGFPPHIAGVYLTVKWARRHPRYQWLVAAAGLALEGVSSFLVPLCTSYIFLIVPIMGMCFGISLVDTALLPMLSYVVDVKYTSIYGSIYAIADISYSIAYAFGPILAGKAARDLGFLNMNIGIAMSSILYAPVLYLLKSICKYKPLEEDTKQLIDEKNADFDEFCDSSFENGDGGGFKYSAGDVMTMRRFNQSLEDD